MTPEEKFNREVWWVLQAIKKELLSTPTGENVKINTIRLTNRDADSPSTDDVSKCVRKLEELGAFVVVEKYDADSYDPYYGANPDWERANAFELAINQLKFDELYHKYEDSLKRDGKKELTPPSPHKNNFDWEKLKAFRERVSNTAVFDNNFRQLIGIELFDFIQENNEVKYEFDRRLNYLKNLADDETFKLLQDNLFRTIQKILKLTSLQEVREKQKEWNNALGNRLKTRRLFNKADEKENIVLTLPELYLELQNKDNYYRLGDSSYFSPMEGEISIVANTHIVPVKKQYEMNVGGFFQVIFSDKFTDNESGRVQFEKLLNEYNEQWYKLDELIYRIPIKLHFQNFERFFFDCVKFYQRQDYEFYHSFLEDSAEQKTEKQFKEIKENALVVIDDLVATLEEKVVLEKSDKPSEKLAIYSIPDKYKISVKDREIWVNKYLIGKPHAVGSNFEFFEYVRSKPANTPIERDKMPKEGDGVGYYTLKEEIKNKGFIKILNELGFKGEILKAFFYKRSKDTLTYRGDKITKEDLEETGIKISLFLKELELAHTKNSPE